MRRVETRPPSFPEVTLNAPLEIEAGVRWQEICGDADHWRVGVYSPAEVSPGDVQELETHDCPELFWLLSGRLVLLMARDGELVEEELLPGRPILVSDPHCGFCPDGPHTGVALVVERDSFDTEYRKPGEMTLALDGL